jgi:DNA primase
MDAPQRAEVDRLKTATPLAAIVGKTLQLKRAGRFMVGLCPFHGETTPSFHVYTDHFHCFGCGAHGDAIEWLAKTRGMGFAEAVAYLGWPGDPSHARARDAGPAPAPALARAPADDVHAQRNRDLARRIWIEAEDSRGSPVET